MTPLYRLMGVVAGSCAMMSRARFGLIPSHIILMLLIGVTPISLGLDFLKNSPQARGPLSFPVSQIADADDGDYVDLSGTMKSTAFADLSTRSSFGVLEDVKRRKGVLVAGSSATGSTSVTGVLHNLSESTQASLSTMHGKSGGVQIDNRVYLAAGEPPALPWTGILLTSFGALVILLIGSSILLRHVIFQPTHKPFRPDAGLTVQGTVEMAFTGVLRLGPKVRGRFLNVPVNMIRSRTGELTFAGQIDGSIANQYGTIANRLGLWSTTMQHGTLDPMEQGNLFAGTKRYAAIRLRYVDIAGSKPRKAVAYLAFPDIDQRDRVQADLERLSTAPAVPM